MTRKSSGASLYLVWCYSDCPTLMKTSQNQVYSAQNPTSSSIRITPAPTILDYKANFKTQAFHR